jgi:hypothetical protein
VYVQCTGQARSTYNMLLGNYERKESYDVLTCRWKLDIKVHVKLRLRVWIGFRWLRIEASSGLL